MHLRLFNEYFKFVCSRQSGIISVKSRLLPWFNAMNVKSSLAAVDPASLNGIYSVQCPTVHTRGMTSFCSLSYYLTIRLRARDFHEIVDEGESRINYHLIEIESVLVESEIKHKKLHKKHRKTRVETIFLKKNAPGK